MKYLFVIACIVIIGKVSAQASHLFLRHDTTVLKAAECN